MIGTAALLLCVLALGDQRNSSLPDGLQPVLVGAAVLVIGISMGSNSGYALNPARDFGPRLFTYIAGWGVDVFKLVVSLWTLLLSAYLTLLLVSIPLLCISDYNGNSVSLQGWRRLVVGSYSGSLCRSAAGNPDL